MKKKSIIAIGIMILFICSMIPVTTSIKTKSINLLDEQVETKHYYFTICFIQGTWQESSHPSFGWGFFPIDIKISGIHEEISTGKKEYVTIQLEKPCEHYWDSRTWIKPGNDWYDDNYAILGLNIKTGDPQNEYFIFGLGFSVEVYINW